ncbi:MAG: sugar nucleotide-binding protein [Ignavibacteria bacterium]|nr:sugar nucleotide-binding protein [Ignavibacteria bacterium]
MKRILITGVSGYIAPYLSKALVVYGDAEVTGVYNSHRLEIEGVEMRKCNLSDLTALRQLFVSAKPDVVYHLASVTPTRITTENDKFIENFNSGVTAEIAKLCNESGALMIYTSTDLVYRTGTVLQEDTSPLEPLTVYAKTKLLGEQSVKEHAGRYIILRTSLVYGFTLSTYTSYFDIVYRSLKNGEPVNAFTDQFRNPIYTEDAADILLKLPGLYRHNDIINFCGSEYLSRYEMCLMMAEAYGFDKGLIKKGSSASFDKYPMVAELGLMDDKLKSYGFATRSFMENLGRAKLLLDLGIQNP